MRKYKNILSILWCVSVFCFMGCDNEHDVEDNKSTPVRSFSLEDLNITVSLDKYVTADITRSSLRDEPILFSENIQCSDELSADIVFAEESNTISEMPSTRVVDDEVTTMSDGNYVIFAYDNSGVCKDYLRFTISNGVVGSYIADPNAVEQWKGDNTLITTNVKRYVCVKEVTGATIDYQNGAVTFSITNGSDFENYFVSDLVEKQLSETDRELTFVMRRQVTCVRIKVNAVDPGIGGTSTLSLLSGKTVCDKLVYDRRNAPAGVHPQNIVKSASTSGSYGTGSADAFQYENKDPDALGGDFAYHAYRDYYLLASPNVTIRDFNLKLKNLKVGDLMSSIQWLTEQNIDFSTSNFKEGFNGVLQANHRYTLNITLRVTKVYDEDDQYPRYPGKEHFYQWDAYEPYTTANDGAWGTGTRTYNPAMTASQSALNCPSVTDLQKYICGEVYWDDGSPFLVRASNGNLLRENGKALRTIKGLYLQKAQYISDSQVDYTVYRKTPILLTDASIRTNTHYFFLPCMGGLSTQGKLSGIGTMALYWAKDAFGEKKAGNIAISKWQVGISQGANVTTENKPTYMLCWRFE